MKNFFAFALMLAGLCLAQDKVAYLKMDKVFAEYYKTFSANVLFEQKKAEFEEKISILKTGLDADVRELQSLAADAENELLAQDARDEAKSKLRVREDIFNGKRSDFERARQLGVKDLTRTKGEAEEMLSRELLDAVRKYAAEYGYTHVWDVSGLSMNRMPMLLVYPEQQDITEAFIESINKGHDDEIKNAKAKLDAMSKKAEAAKTGDAKGE